MYICIYIINLVLVQEAVEKLVRSCLIKSHNQNTLLVLQQYEVMGVYKRIMVLKKIFA